MKKHVLLNGFASEKSIEQAAENNVIDETLKLYYVGYRQDGVIYTGYSLNLDKCLKAYNSFKEFEYKALQRASIDFDICIGRIIDYQTLIDERKEEA